MKSKTISPCNRSVCVETDNDCCNMIIPWDLLLEHTIMFDSLKLILCLFGTHPESSVIESVLNTFLRQLLWLVRMDVIDDFGVLIDLFADQPK